MTNNQPSTKKAQTIPAYKFVEWGKQGGQKSAKKNSARLRKFWREHKRENFIQLCPSCHRQYDKTLKQAINNVEKVELST